MDNTLEVMHENIRMLGKLLGEIILESHGIDTYNLIEKVRRLSKLAHNGDTNAQDELFLSLQNLKNEEFLPLARSFNQFLNLTNTAEQHSLVSSALTQDKNPVNFIEVYQKLRKAGVSDKKIQQAVSNLSIDLVLTAHPTEINRRSLINNLNQVDACLSWLDLDIADYKKKQIRKHLKQLIAQYWHTDEIRQNRPTPNEEAKWGYEVIENSLWIAVPQFLKELEEQMQETMGFGFALDARPIHFSSWMGGDRDGNPNVTSKTTTEVLLDSRIRATRLFLNDIEILVKELSMRECTAEFRAYINDNEVQEPYRKLMIKIRTALRKTLFYLEQLNTPEAVAYSSDMIINEEQLRAPLIATYNSLVACNMRIIANDNLLNTIRRLKCFGLTLTQLDIRQESTIHTEALGEITRYLDIGDYEQWSEKEKQDFLLKELQSKRPLIPQNWSPSPQTKELLDTCHVIASTPEGIIPTYVISMTQAPSDILAVYLLLKEVNCAYHLPVTPLFETLNDLNNSKKIMNALFDIEWYKETIGGKQMIMIGYSDSAKDAGVLAAGWAQYSGQEGLIELCKKYDIQLTLFHGRGGTIGRGGAPAKVALFSQPPGSLQGGLRVTEQGEMIRFKFAKPDLAIETLSLYTDAILEANLLPPPAPLQEWRDTMDRLSKTSCEAYQNIVRKTPNFIPYFYQATPEAELGKLPLGSRPAKRRPNGGVESLRAIPWIFGWTQNRLMLPSWLGAGSAFRLEIEENTNATLMEMYNKWPFFETRVSMLEMVFSKSDIQISEYYDNRLVDKNILTLGVELRELLKEDVKTILKISERKYLNENIPHLADNIHLRNIYTNPLNVLQVELLERCRKNENHPEELEQALMITISGIAAGMRNSG